MRLLLAAGLVLAALLPPDGAGEGRRGNALYQEGLYEEAAAAYRAGLDLLTDASPPELRAALWNNLGSALYRTGDFQGATEAFAQSMIAAPTDAELARAAYNMGNTAHASEDLQGALQAYKTALLADPAYEDARHNYEVVARQMENDPTQQNQQQDRIEPSEYARALKAQAEALVAEERYGDAYDLMMGGLQRDPSVRAFQTFITRLNDVATIDRTAAPPTTVQ